MDIDTLDTTIPAAAPVTPTTLEITFHCMCLFVRDEQAGRVHVLMPPTCACGHEPVGEHTVQGVDLHVVRVVYPREGGRLNAAGDAFVDDPLEGKADYLEMEGWSLVLPGTGAGVTGGGFPAEVVDLSGVTGRRISRALLGAQRDPRVAARITLDAGRFEGHFGVAVWDFEGQELEMAQDVVWTVEGLPPGPLAWSRTRLKPAGERAVEGDYEALPPLHPDEDGVIQITVYHAMERDFPKLQEREPDVTAQHFSAFYRLFDNPGTTPIPTFLRFEHHGTAGCLGAAAMAE